MAGLTAWPLMKVLGNTGSLIVHILLLFILVMAVTGATLLEVIDSIRGPMRRLKETYEDNQEVRRARREAREQMMEEQLADHEDERAARLEERKRQAIIAEQAGRRYESRFNIDVAMSDEDAQEAAQKERRRADKKAAAVQEKKESSAQDWKKHSTGFATIPVRQMALRRMYLNLFRSLKRQKLKQKVLSMVGIRTNLPQMSRLLTRLLRHSRKSLLPVRTSRYSRWKRQSRLLMNRCLPKHLFRQLLHLSHLSLKQNRSSSLPQIRKGWAKPSPNCWKASRSRLSRKFRMISRLISIREMC